MSKPDGEKLRFTFAGSIYFDRMKELGFIVQIVMLR